MAGYEKIYLMLFNAITDAIRLLQAARQEKAVSDAIGILQTAQQNVEEAYLCQD